MEMGGERSVEEHSWLALALSKNTEDFVERFVWNTHLITNI